MWCRDRWLKLNNGKRFNGRTKREYECSDGYHKIDYGCYYYLPEKVSMKIYCEFASYYPMFGHEDIYGPGCLEKLKKLELVESSLDNFSTVPTVVWNEFKFESEHLPSSEDEKDLQVFHEKVSKEIEELMPSIIGDGSCISRKEVLELDARDRNYPDGDYDDEFYDIK